MPTVQSVVVAVDCRSVTVLHGVDPVHGVDIHGVYSIRGVPGNPAPNVVVVRCQIVEGIDESVRRRQRLETLILEALGLETLRLIVGVTKQQRQSGHIAGLNGGMLNVGELTVYFESVSFSMSTH